MAEDAAERPRRRRGGRKRDAVWQETTVRADKTVLCNRCHGVIHRYGVTKVERVRAHFLNKCAFAKRPRGEGASEGPAAIEGPAALEPRARKADYASRSGMFKRRLARWVFAAALPFASVESELLVVALRSLRNDAVPPSRAELENELLELEYNASVARVQKALTTKRCCLTVENWVDTTGALVTSFAGVSGGTAHYLESMPAKQAGAVARTNGVATDFAGEISLETVDAVMAKHKKSFFCCVVAPTAATLSKTTQEKIQKKHPQCNFFYGCVCHALRLVMSDMATVLPWLGCATASVLEIVNVFHENHKLQSQLQAPQTSPDQSHNSPTLLPTAASLCDSIESVLSLEQELYAVVARRDFIESTASPQEQVKLKRIQDFVLSDSFVQDLVNSLAILRPLHKHLKNFEVPRVPLSLVLASFHNLLDVYGKMEWINKKDKALISSCVNDRLDAIYSNVHGVANMLDPLHLGVNMDPSKKRDAEAFIVQYCNQNVKPLSQHDGEFDVLEQLSKLKEMVADLKSSKPTYWGMLLSGSVHPIKFWVDRPQFPQLQQIAWTVFDLPVASTAPNVAFGQFGHLIHSRFHTTLSAEKIRQLTHVYCNSRSASSSPLTTIIGAPSAEADLLVHGI